MSETDEPVYGRPVIEFVAVANEYCKYAEHAGELKGDEILSIMQRLLPFLYLKASLLPTLEPVFEDGNEKFVLESDWQRIHDLFSQKLSATNDYLDLKHTGELQDGEPAASSLAEDFADIYQDMKNFILLYQTGTTEVMNDAVWECRLNFENYWGVSLLSSLRAIHRFLSSQEITGRKIKDTDGIPNEHGDWFISKRQKEFRDENE